MYKTTMKTAIMALMLTPLMGADCAGDVKGDSGDTGSSTTAPTGTTSPTLVIDLVQTGCDADGWFYYAETSAWTGDATANAWEVRDDENGWNEEHSMPSVDFDPNDPSYDILERTLADGASVGDFTADVNTVFACGTHDQKDAVGMTYAVRVYDTDLNFADCAIWGAGVDAVFAGDSSVPAWNDVSNASEISADNCVVF
jgi:hypothetical protein